jgi:hypothetical protein
MLVQRSEAFRGWKGRPLSERIIQAGKNFFFEAKHYEAEGGNSDRGYRIVLSSIAFA